MKLFAILIALLSAVAVQEQSLTDWIDSNCEQCTARMSSQTGAYILEKGEEALIGRAWLAQHATRSIDIQYFIWSTDNVGIIAAEQLLSAAERSGKGTRLGGCSAWLWRTTRWDSRRNPMPRSVK